MKNQINLRASARTINQINSLVSTTGMSKTELISVAIDRFYQEENKMEKSLLTQFAHVAANAYINQFVSGGSPVMDDPVIYYSLHLNKFGSCSSLTPLGDDDVLVQTIAEGMYGDESNPTYRGIVEFITDQVDAKDLLYTAIAEAIYSDNYDGDDNHFRADKVSEIYNWLAEGDISSTTFKAMSDEWSEYDAGDPYSLDIFEVTEGTDEWPLINTIKGKSEEDCFDKAYDLYGSNPDGYHWTNPY